MTRTDYITLSSTDSFSFLDGTRRGWLIQPHMFRNWQPNDIVTMQLIGCQFRATVNIANSDTIIICANLNAKNAFQEDSTTCIGVTPGFYETENTLLTPSKLQYAPRLEVERPSNIVISAYTTVELEISDTLARFIFEIKYHRE